MGLAIHAVAKASEVDLLLRQLRVVESKLPRPLNRLVRGGGRSAGERQDPRVSVRDLLVSGGGLVAGGGSLLSFAGFGTQRKLSAAAITAAAT